MSDGFPCDGFDPEYTSAYIGAGPFTMHVYLADGKKEHHKPTSVIVHYGDEELEVRPERIWAVLKELFGERGREDA